MSDEVKTTWKPLNPGEEAELFRVTYIAGEGETSVHLNALLARDDPATVGLVLAHVVRIHEEAYQRLGIEDARWMIVQGLIAELFTEEELFGAFAPDSSAQH